MDNTATGFDNGEVSASDWFKGIGLSILASIIGGASKLLIRKSWILSAQYHQEDEGEEGDDEYFDSILNSSSSSGLVAANEGDDEDSTNPILLCDGDGTTATTFDEPLSLDSLSLSPIRRHHLHHSTSSDHNDDPHHDDRNRWRRSTTATAISTSQTKYCLPYLLRGSGMFGLSVLNPICCVLAMNYASPSILAPFSGLTLVWVILFSHPVVGETPTRQQIIAASLILVGELIVAVFGDHTNDDGVTVEDVEKSYRDPYFILYFIALSVYVLLLTYWMFLSKNPRKRKFAWGTCGGCLTGLQNFLKDALTIMKATPADVPHYSWLFYFFFIMAGVSAFGGFLILTACMKRYDASYSAAGFVGSFVVSASIMSAVHYNTFGELKGIVNYIMYPIGLLVLTLGVFVLVGESKDVNHHNGEEGDDVEDIMNDALFSGRTGRRARKNSDMDTTPAFAYTKVEDDEPAPTDLEDERVV